MAVPWQQILIDALDGADVVAVGAVVRRHLGRVPNRAEITAARRAAHLYVNRGQARLVHFPVGGSQVLLLARLDADLTDDERLHDLAAERTHPSTRRGTPRSEVQVVNTLTRHVCSAGVAGRRVNVARLDPADAEAFAADLGGALRDLERLRARLRRRAGEHDG